MDAQTRDRLLALAGVETRGKPGQRYHHWWIPTAEFDKVAGFLKDKFGNVSTETDWKGVHFTIATNGEPVKFTVSALDLAGFGLALLSGPIGTAAEAALIAGRVQKAARLTRAAKAASVAGQAVAVGGAVSKVTRSDVVDGETRDRLLRVAGVDVRDQPPVDEVVDALVAAIRHLTEGESRAWTAAEAAMHPRVKGGPRGGEFKSVFDRMVDALTAWSRGEGPADPFEGQFTREQMRRVAKDLGLNPRPRIPEKDLKNLLFAHIRENVQHPVDRPRASFTLKGGAGKEGVAPLSAETRERLAKELSFQSRLFRGAVDETDRNASTELGELAAGVRDGSIPDAEVSDRLAALAKLYAGQITQDNLRQWSREFDRKGRGVLRDLDVGVYVENKPNSRIFLRRETNGKPGTILESFDDLDALHSWAQEHGETELAGWVDKERGGSKPVKKAAPAKRVPAKKAAPSAATAGATSAQVVLDSPPVHVSARSIGRNVDDVRGLDHLTPAQREKVIDAVAAYRGLGYTGINQHLRTGRPARGAKGIVAGIDLGMAQSPLPHDVTVYRSLKTGESTLGPSADWPDDLTGREWTDLAYGSTTASQDIMAAQDNARVVMRIHVPAGTGAMKLSDHEMEVLLQRGLRYRVVADHGPTEMTDGWGRTHRFDRLLDVEVVPADPEPSTADRLAAAKTREEAHAALDGLTAAQLREVAKSTGSFVGDASTKDAMKTRIVEHTVGQRLNFQTITQGSWAGAAPPAETAAIARQALVKKARSAHDAIADVEELIHSGASDRALSHRITSLSKMPNGTTPAMRDRLLAAVGDEPAMRQVIADIRREEGLTPIGAPGDVVPFDPERHRSIGGDIPRGTPVTVIKPGHQFEHPELGPGFYDEEGVTFPADVQEGVADVPDRPSSAVGDAIAAIDSASVKADAREVLNGLTGAQLAEVFDHYDLAPEGGSKSARVERLLVHTVGARTLAKTTADAAVPSAPSVPTKATPATAGALDVREFAADLIDPISDQRELDSIQEKIDAGQSLPQIGRDLERLAARIRDGVAIAGAPRTGVDDPEFEAAKAASKANAYARADRLQAVAERLKTMRRPAKKATKTPATATPKVSSSAASTALVDAGDDTSAIASILAPLRALDAEARRDALDLRLKSDLQALLKSMGLPVSGTKRDLVDRLVSGLEVSVTRSLEPDVELEDEFDEDEDDFDDKPDVAAEPRSLSPEVRARTLALAGIETRAAGKDVTPGNEKLHHYWTKGEGLAKWINSPHQWTALYHHLVKYVNPEMAKRMASAWLHEVTGEWAGSDIHRVHSGKPPRGDRIGPG